VEQALQHKCLGEKGLNLLRAPLPCGQLLHKQHQLLEIHLLQLRRPIDEEDCADVDVEGRETFGGLRDVCVPEPDHAGKRKFTQEEAVHPAEGELQEVKALLL